MKYFLGMRALAPFYYSFKYAPIPENVLLPTAPGAKIPAIIIRYCVLDMTKGSAKPCTGAILNKQNCSINYFNVNVHYNLLENL